MGKVANATKTLQCLLVSTKLTTSGKTRLVFWEKMQG